MHLKAILIYLFLLNSLAVSAYGLEKKIDPLHLSGNAIDIQVDQNIGLTVSAKDGTLLAQTSSSCLPTIMIRGEQMLAHSFLPSDTQCVSADPWQKDRYQGYAISLRHFKELDVVLQFIIALNSDTDEVMVQAEQIGGRHTVVGIKHLYCFEKPVSEGGYMVMPHGSGYLVPAECTMELPGKGSNSGFIGTHWSLPMFGFVGKNGSSAIIVDTWWDCEVKADHISNQMSALDFVWRPSLGRLAYPRRVIMRFDRQMDYVSMAKWYRRHAEKKGLIRTLKEKAAETPIIYKYIKNILYRWYKWDTGDRWAEEKDVPQDNSEIIAQSLSDVRRLQDMGFGINFFFPKWTKENYWEAFLLDQVKAKGGWATVADWADEIHRLNCPIQCFINHRKGPTYDALDRLRRALDNVASKGFNMDILYFDGYASNDHLPDVDDVDEIDFYAVSRRQNFEAQNECFKETRRRGIMPGGEVARFWCMADCDYFFFTDWARDRLTNVPTKGAPDPVGIPIPLFQLVFHDCYMAGFSGGGYAQYHTGYDWWPHRTPRLYELLFVAAPAFNWLPDGATPIRDWDSEFAQNRWKWLNRWSSYFQKVALSEMVSHKFLNDGRTIHRIEFANGVVAEFNMTDNEMRIQGVEGFTGKWEKPEILPDYSSQYFNEDKKDLF